MASKDAYSGCFNIFSDDDSDWDANPDYEDWSSEGDLDAASTPDEIDGQCCWPSKLVVRSQGDRRTGERTILLEMSS